MKLFIQCDCISARKVLEGFAPRHNYLIVPIDFSGNLFREKGMGLCREEEREGNKRPSKCFWECSI